MGRRHVAGARRVRLLGSAQEHAAHGDKRRSVMLWTRIVVLLVPWLLGIVTSYTMGGLIRILLVIPVIVLIVRLVSRRRVVWAVGWRRRRGTAEVAAPAGSRCKG